MGLFLILAQSIKAKTTRVLETLLNF